MVKQGFATYNEQTGEYSGIYVTGVSNGGRTLTFQVDKGADLSRPLPIQVGAIDDRITELNEDYSVVLNNIKASDPGYVGAPKPGEKPDPDDANLVIGKDREVGTIIVDDATSQHSDGYYVGVGPNQGNESDKKIDLNIHIFQRDSNGNIVEANKNNPPSEEIKVGLKVGAGSDKADIDHDYYVNGPKGSNDHAVKLGTGDVDNGGVWKFVEGSPEGGQVGDDGYVPAHWQYVGSDAYIPLNDDRANEGDENFTVTVDSVSGHESHPLPTDKPQGDIGKSTDGMTILDDYNLPGSGAKDILDGPDLAYFGPAAEVIEPVASDKPGPKHDKQGNVTEDSDIVNTVKYKVIMTDDVAQDTVVFIDIKNANFDDFEPHWGNGANGTLGKYEPDNLAADGKTVFNKEQLEAKFPELANHEDFPSEGGYFVIIPKGSAEGNFNVDIKHDHDTTNERGLDQTGRESIDMEITDIRGSENVFSEKQNAIAEKEAAGTKLTDAEKDYKDLYNSNETIKDDMKGPEVLFDNLASAKAGDPVEFTVRLANGIACSEDVVVKIAFTDAKGNITYGYITIPAGATEYTGKLMNEAGDVQFNMPNSSQAYAQIVGVNGGEAQRDTDVDYINMREGNGPGRGNMVIDVNAKDIYEGGVNGSDKPESVSYEVTFTGVEQYTNYSDTDDDGFSFTIRTVNNTTSDKDFEGDKSDTEQGEHENTDVTISLNHEFMHDIVDGNDFTLVVVPGADGYPKEIVVKFPEGSGKPDVTLNVDGTGKVTYGEGQNQKDYGNVDGKLPTAYDDKLIEGNEQFSPIVVNPEGVEPAGDPKEVTIIDNDKPIIKVVYCDAYGNELGPDALIGKEGGDPVYVKVVLEDGAGNRLSLGDGDATFNLSGSSSTGAEAGTDYVFEKDSVVIPNGASESGPVKIHLPEDYQSDGDQKLTVNAAYENGANKVNNYEGILTTPGTNPGDPSKPVSGGSSELLIKEHINSTAAFISAFQS